MGTSNNRWGVILARGDGTRLLPLTRSLFGDDRPKQYCALMGPETLLEQARRRVGRLVTDHRTMLVLTRAMNGFFGCG
jgi:mannose-1-phosphate guanylyltransferase